LLILMSRVGFEQRREMDIRLYKSILT
jgi:hypothetical protein